jgi:hypothetical protein
VHKNNENENYWRDYNAEELRGSKQRQERMNENKYQLHKPKNSPRGTPLSLCETLRNNVHKNNENENYWRDYNAEEH